MVKTVVPGLIWALVAQVWIGLVKFGLGWVTTYHR